MSTFEIRIQIGDLAGRRFEELTAIVDTGSTFTAASRELLESLGIRPTRRQRFQVVSGDVIESDVGNALLRLGGVETATPVIFNEPGEPTLLGAVILESLLFAVDPVNQRLIPVDGLRI